MSRENFWQTEAGRKCLEMTDKCVQDIRRRHEERFGANGDLYVDKNGNVRVRATGRIYEHK